MTRIKKGGLISSFAIGIVLVLTLGASGAWADQLTYTLGTPNGALQPYTGPYADVTVSVTGGVATITATARSGFLIGDGGSVGLNTAAAQTASGFSWSGGNGNTAFTNGGTGNEDGFGSFKTSANNFDGYNSSVTSVTFTISGTYADAASVLVANSQGAKVAAHIFVAGDGGALVTGFAADGGTAVPEPTTISLLAALGGLMAFAAVRLRSQNVS